MQRSVPSTWRELLVSVNGVDLFVASMCLCGVLPGGLMRRSIDDPQPLSIESANGPERPRGAAVEPQDFVVGWNSLDDGAAYVLRGDESISKTDRDGGRTLTSWASLGAMLETEYQAIATLYDNDGTFGRPA
jgi:hypothetical protein